MPISQERKWRTEALPLSEYTRILKQRGWIIVLTAVVAAVSALLFSIVQQPIYQSTIKLNVIGARPDLGLSQTVKSLLRNYAGQIKSYNTAEQALANMPEPLDLTPEALLSKINVQAVESDLLLLVEAEDQDPVIAQMIAQTMADTFVWNIDVYNDTLDKRDRVYVFASGPATPGHKVSPQKKLNTLAGGILGGVVGFAIVLLLEWLDSFLIRKPSDIQRDVGLPVLAQLHSSPSAAHAYTSAGQLAGQWTIPIAGGVAVGALLATVVYLLF